MVLERYNISEMDIKIAKFLGWYNVDGHDNGSWFKEFGHGQSVVYSFYSTNTSKLPFSSDWNFLWEVIDKINGLGKEYSFSTLKTYCACSVEKGGSIRKDFRYAHSINIAGDVDSIGAVYKLVCNFISWYNENLEICKTV
jgi:hypothetical protein